MFTPETIGTLAALLSFIEFMIRLATFLSPQEKRALGEARTKIKALNPSSPVDQAKSILSEAIQKHVPAPQVEVAREDLHLGFKALEEYVLGLEGGNILNMLQGVNTSGNTALPMYGDALSFLCKFIGRKLAEWKCFNAWGTQLPDAKPKRHFDYYLLAMPKSDKAIRSIRYIQAAVPKSYASVSWCFYDYTSSQDHGIHAQGLIKTEGTYIQGFNYASGKEVHNLQYTTLEFAEYAVWIRQHFPSHDTKQIISADDTERVAAGLLADLIDYSRRVRDEVQKSESITSRLSGLLRG